MNTILPGAYLSYIALAAGATLWMAAQLARHAPPLMRGLFGGNADLAYSANHLVTVGIVLGAIGLLAMLLPAGGPAESGADALYYLTDRAALVLLLLAAIFYIRLHNLLGIVRRHRPGVEPPRPARTVGDLPAA